MRHPYKMRKVVRQFTIASSVKGYEHVKLKREELECGHIVRARDAQSAAEAIGRLAHSMNGTTPKRRCFECSKVSMDIETLLDGKPAIALVPAPAKECIWIPLCHGAK